MSLAHCINECLEKKFKAEWVPKDLRVLSNDMYQLFKVCGEGIYSSELVSTGNDFVSKMIAWISGKFSHAVHIIYDENLRSKITDDEYERLITNWKIYYGLDRVTAEAEFAKVKILVLGSADKNGMNYPDFSVYQQRIQCIKKMRMTPDKSTNLLRWYLSVETFDADYDYTGLTFWPLCKTALYKILDDKKAYFCSEIMNLAGKAVRYTMYSKKYPSPTQLYKYDNGDIIYQNF